MIKQVMFKDLENNEIHGGILLENGDVICGCCGRIQEADERGSSWVLLCNYEDAWINLDEAICGDDFESTEE